MSIEHTTAEEAYKARARRPSAGEASYHSDLAPLASSPSALMRLLANGDSAGRSNRSVRQAAVLQLQRSVGNRATQRLLQRQGAAPALVVQRVHTGVAVNPEEVKTAFAPPSSDTSEADEEETSTSGEADQGTTATTATTAPGQTASQPARPARPTSATPPLPPPGLLRQARAQAIIQEAYGQNYTLKAKARLIPIEGRKAFDDHVDKIQIRRKVLDPDGKRWKKGTAEQKYTNRSQFIEGIADAENDVAYVLKTATLTTAPVHELLHVNTSSAWSSQMGNTLDEGMTETLAINALKTAGVDVSESNTAYPVERKLLNPVKQAVGSLSVLRDAYFNGPDSMISAYNSKPGKGKWKELLNALEAKDFDKVRAVLAKKEGT